MKTALVLGGGGSRGAYEIGVWQALREKKIHFSMVIGSSVGAINGAVIAQNSFDEAVSLWQELTTEMVFDLPSGTEGITKLLGPYGVYAKEFVERGGAGCEALRKLLKEYIHEDTIRQSGIRYGMVTVMLDGMRPHYLFIEDIPKGKLVDYMLASSACFPALKFYKLDGIPMIDGGYRDNLPVKMALEGGAKKIIAVDLKAFGLIDEKTIRKAGKAVTRIVPSRELSNFLIFDKAETKRAIRLGYLDTLKALGFCEGETFCFKNGESARLRRGYLLPCVGLANLCGLPPGGKTRLRERAAAASLYSHLRATENGGVLSDAVLMMAEDAGSLFGMPHDRIYSGEEYLSELYSVYRFYDGQHAGELLSLRAELARLSPVSAAKFLHERGGRLFVTALAAEILCPARNQEELRLAASLCPREFSAALLLAAMRKGEGHGFSILP